MGHKRGIILLLLIRERARISGQDYLAWPDNFPV